MLMDLACSPSPMKEGPLFEPGLHLHAHRLLGNDGGSSWPLAGPPGARLCRAPAPTRTGYDLSPRSTVYLAARCAHEPLMRSAQGGHAARSAAWAWRECRPRRR